MSGKDSKSGKQESASNSNENESKNRDPDVPDRSYGDFFCGICDSHMNSDAMWEAHVTGKRHIKNVKKGDTDSKYDFLEGEESSMKYELRNVKDPVVGLSYIHEIRRREPNVPPMYNCFLCHATIATVPLVIEHVISMKHRLNYMKENSPDDYQLLGATNLKKGHMEPLVLEAAIKMEQKYGRGVVKVKQEKPKVGPAVTYKRSYDDDDDRDSWKPSKNPKIDKNWKPLDSMKRSSRSERSRSPVDFKDRKKMLYSDEEYSKNSYKRSSKTDISPWKDDYPRSYSRLSDRDDYSRKYDYDRHSRARSNSRERSDYNLSPEYGRSSSYLKELDKRDTYSRKSPPNDYYEQSRSRDTQDDYLLPHEKSMDTSFSAASPELKYIIQKVFSFPPELFLKVMLTKLDYLELNGIEELNLLSRIINKSQVLLCNKLPPDLQAALREKLSLNSESVQKNIPGLDIDAVMPSGMPNISSRNFDLQSAIASNRLNNMTSYKLPNSQDVRPPNFMSNLLNTVKNSNSPVPGSQNAPAPQNTNLYPGRSQATANAYQTQNVNMYPSGSSTQDVSNSYQNQNMTYKGVQYPNLKNQFEDNKASGQRQRYPYNSSRANVSNVLSAIPGLTLTEQASAPQPFNNYQQYSSPSANNQNYNYRY